MTAGQITKEIQKYLSLTDTFFRKSIEASPVPIMIHGDDGEVFKLSDSWLRLSGYSREEIPDLEHWLDLAYGGNFPEMTCQLQKGEDQDFQRCDGAYWIRMKSGEKRLWEFHSSAIGTAPDGRRVYECVALDITEKELLVQKREKDRQFFKTILHSVGDGVITCNEKGRVVFLNRMAEILIGITEKEAKGKPLEQIFQILKEPAKERVIDLHQQVKKRRQSTTPVNHTLLITTSGLEVPVEYNITPLLGKHGLFEGSVLVFRDFTDKQARMDRVEYLGYHDNLTGLYNRRFLEEEMSRLDTERNLPITLIMGDVNGLKLMNDVFGHESGDLLLKEVAESLKHACRNDEIISRQGGDEFVILLPGADEEKARGIVERIKGNLSEKRIHQLELSVSFGIGVKTTSGENLQETLNSAEEAMYRQKLFDSPKAKEKALDRIILMYQEKNELEGVRVERLAQACNLLGTALGFNEEKLESLRQAGFLHDIGKIALDSKTFIKEGHLSSQEWQNVRRHSEIGYRILSTVGELAGMAEYVLYHHEKWDGKGYPRGLKGDDIPLESRVLAIVDAYEAMTSHRPYREPMPEEKALAELEKHAGTQFDPELVRIFVEKWQKGSDDSPGKSIDFTPLPY